MNKKYIVRLTDEEWAMADQLVELQIVDSISPETVRQTLKQGHDQADDRVLGNPFRR